MQPQLFPQRRKKSLVSILSLLTVLLLSGCSVKPWVKPYQRHNFADPIMSADRDPVASAYVHHVYQAREGARGAEGGAGGGCGCN